MVQAARRRIPGCNFLDMVKERKGKVRREDKTVPVATGGKDEGFALDATVVPKGNAFVESSYHLRLWRAG